MIETLSESEIWSLLDEAVYGHLGCCAGGKPYVVPFSFVREERRLLALTTAGKKIDLMRANPQVCVQAEVVQSLSEWRSVVLNGRFVELSGPERTRVAGLMIDKYGEMFGTGKGEEGRRGRDVTPPRLDQRPEPYIAYAIEIEEWAGRRETSVIPLTPNP